MHPESTHAQLIPKAQSSDCIKHSVLNLFLYFSLFIITMRADVVKKFWIWVKTPLGAVALMSGSCDVTLGHTFLAFPPLDVYDLGHALQLSWRHISFNISLICQFKSSDSPIIKSELWLLFLFQHEHGGLFWVVTPVSEQVQPASACPV